MPTKFQAWCAVVEQTESGRVTLSNIYHDAVRGRLPYEVRRKFYQELTAVIDERDPDPDRQLEVMKELLERRAAEFACAASDPATGIGCSHFVPDLWFFKSNTDSLRRGWAIQDTVPLPHLREITAGRARWGTIPPRPFERAWVTQTASINTTRNSTDRAELIRQKLGLLRFFELADLYLLEVRYPADLFDGGGLFPPMFLDGSTVVVYRSKAAGQNWGSAVDLDSGKSYADGFPEAVHRKVSFTAAFEVELIGVMRLMTHDPDALTLHVRTPDPWQPGRGAELEDLLK